MPEDRTPIIIVGVLAVIFAIALFDRLGQPLPTFRESSDGSSIANFIYLAIIGTMIGSYFLIRSNERAMMLRNLLIWGVIIAGIVFVVQLFGGK